MNYGHWFAHHFSYIGTQKVINQSGPKTIMLNLPEVACRRVAEPCDAGADGMVVRAPTPPESESVCLCRLARLAPHVANELLELWGTPHLAGRLLEELLGGEHELDLQTEVLIELVRLYQYLEDVPAAGAPLDHRSGA